jgi:hypothetical protein
MLATKASGPLFALSTAGNARSMWWWNRLDAARMCAQMGMPDGHCLVEYSALDDADLFDEVVWWSCMPALGETISVESIRADLASMGRSSSRAYLNRRPSVDEAGWKIIPRDIWEAARMTRSTAGAGYGGDHEKERAVGAGCGGRAGRLPRGRCLYGSRRIPPGAAWDLGHNVQRTAWTGPWHSRCNRSRALPEGIGRGIGHQCDEGDHK